MKGQAKFDAVCPRLLMKTETIKTEPMTDGATKS